MSDEQEEVVIEQTKPFQINKWQVVEAYKLLKANRGSAGIDNQSLQDFEQNLKGIYIKSGTAFLLAVRCHLW